MRTLDDLLAEGVRGTRVLVRADLNVPLDGHDLAGHTSASAPSNGAADRVKVADDGRIRAVLPTLDALRGAGARLVVCSHLGRPKGQAKDELRLKPIGEHLAELLGQPVLSLSETVGDTVSQAIGRGSTKEIRSL